MAVSRLFVEIGGDTSKLNASLREAIATAQDAGVKITRAGQSFISAFDHALNPTKALEEQIKLLQVAGKSTGDIMAVMGEKLKTAVSAAEANKQPISEFVRNLAKAGEEGNKTRFSIEGLGKGLTDFARSPLQTAKTSLTGVLESIGPVAVGIGGIGAAAVAAGSYLVSLAKDAADTAEQLQNLSIQTGLATQDLQALQQVGKEKGVELDLAKQLGKLNKELADTKGTGSDFVRTLNALRYAQGLPAADLSKGLLPALVELRERVLAIEDPFERAKAQSAALGKGFASLQPIIFDSDRSIVDLVESMKRTDAVWGPDVQEKLMAFDDVLDTLSRTFTGIKNSMAIATVEALRWFDVIEAGGKKIPTAQEKYEQWAKAGKGLPQFGPEPFAVRADVGGKDPFKDVSAALARADAIAQGTKTAIELQIKLKQAEEDYAAAKKDNDVAAAARLADVIAGLKNQIKTQQDSAEATKKWTEAWAKGMGVLDSAAYALQVLEKATRLAREATEQATQSLQPYISLQEIAGNLTMTVNGQPIEDWLTDEAARWDRLNASMLPGIEGLNKLQGGMMGSSQGMKWDEDFWFNPGRYGAQADIAIIADAQARAMEESYKRGQEGIKKLRDSAGHIFDDMLTGSKNIWQDLLRTFENIFLAPVRIAFQNLAQWLFSGTKPSGGIFGTGGGQGGLGQMAGGFSMGGLGLSGGSALALGIPAASAMAIGSSNAYAKGLGYTGLGLTGLAGVASLATGMPFMTAMTTMFTNPITAAIAGAVVGGIALWKAAVGKNAYQAGGMEASRDFGVNFSTDQMKQFLQGKGISEESAYPIRKDIESSPQFLTQLGQIAKQQGTYDTFLSRLEKVTTSWGTFNFRKAYEIGDLTGDWTALDKAFTEAFESSQALQQNLPNWKDILTISGDAAKKAASEFESLWNAFQESGEMTQQFTDFLDQNAASLDAAAQKSSAFAEQLAGARAAMEKFIELQPDITGFGDLKSALQNISGTAEKTIYQSFLETGIITDELAGKIKEFGGDLADFEKLANLSKISNDFQTLVQHFQETGEVLPELRQMFADFGGDLSALDKVAGLPGLMQGLQGINDLISGLQGLTKGPIQQILSGEWGAETWGGLSGMGLDPSKLTGIADLTKFEHGWDQAVSDFYNKTTKVWDPAQQKYLTKQAGLEKGGILEQALWKFGGAGGTTALQNYASGFNTITPDLLAATKAAMDASYQSAIKSTLDYLGTAQKETADKIGTMTTAVTGEFDAVGKNISDATAAAAKDVIGELDLMLQALNQIIANTAPAGSGIGADAVDVPAAASGGLVRVHDQEAVLDRDQTRNLLRNEGGAGPTIILQGPIYGWNDFVEKVREAGIDLKRRGAWV